MANNGLFASVMGRLMPATDTRNQAGAPAYAFGPRHHLAQLAVTGCLNHNFYTSDADQLARVLALSGKVPPAFLAKLAVYARERGGMKDMPALLLARLTVQEPDLVPRIFGRVIDNGRMLRTVVQILRSGTVGRKSLGTRPKRLVREWLEKADTRTLLRAATGSSPSLADIIRMVHPRPATPEREAFYGWLIGKPYQEALLPEPVRAFEAWKRDRTLDLPDVPFEWLTALPLTREDWALLASRMGWQALRINLNSLARHGAFTVPGTAEKVAARLSDAQAVAATGVQPFQIMMARGQVTKDVPEIVQAALEVALQHSLRHVPALAGRVVVCPDVSGSMGSALTGQRKGATSSVRCIDVAALTAAALMQVNAGTRILPFDFRVVPVELGADLPVAENARRLAAIGGGGTDCAAPLALLNAERARPDLVILVSDYESWRQQRANGTPMLAEWRKLKARHPAARLVCLDIQPYGTTQAPDGEDILNIGGFTDAVFDSINRFAQGKGHPDLWVAEIDSVVI
ncbi:RNA-binding protein [Niveispirillum sp. SYP-B3756]|uniref:vWA domain-containing protein n=1 Tax=Niveispirillum sp. SYP-B3756 TaxID=2662178 RepID=UPI0012921B9C|nr:RNA-binding protein [Niveispirillum sp. SYP-B3756]MQP68106.1 RNA-binding protein [Niveispirillum sp. SYP-B3756]